MRKALVFGGGGALGAYEIGVWQAIKENDIKYDILLGVSIGALTAALVVQDRFEEGNKLWETIEVDKVIKHGVNFDFDLDLLMSQKEKLIPLLQSSLKNKGVDVAPLFAIIKDLCDIDRIKNSKIPTYILAVEVPNLKPHFINLQEVDDEDIPHYLMASASCFPVFPIKEVGKKKFIDGGYYDNLPISKALKLGADEVLAINLKAPGIIRKSLKNDKRVKIIEPYWSLGGFFNFTTEQATRNIKLGYNDGQKIFGNLSGFAYTFKDLGPRLSTLSKSLEDKILNINKTKTNKAINKISLLLKGTDKNLLKRYGEEIQSIDYTLRLIERIMEISDYQVDRVYDLNIIIKQLQDLIKKEERKNIKDWIAKFIKNPQSSINEFERKDFLISIAFEFNSLDSNTIALVYNFLPNECLLALLINCLEKL